MKVFAISDLHLSGLKEKPMDIFGEVWEGHFEKITADWNAKVAPEDIVLIGGDTSWGMKPEEGMYDIARLAPLPGKKVFIRGNHDYWWNGITRVRAAAPDESFFFLQNDCVRLGEYVIAGSRGRGLSRRPRLHRARRTAVSARSGALPSRLSGGEKGAHGGG